jgi:8-oxo-dGTP pyrophosphatase MutT (NUDIX family)
VKPVRSAGCLLYRVGTRGPEFLLIRHAAGHWDFPKGHVEPGESVASAMRRETLEETGLRFGAPLPGWVGRIRYRVRDRGRGPLRPKTVLYRLAKARPGRVRLSAEHTRAIWAGERRALALLSFANARRLLRNAAGRLRRGA